MSFRLTGSRENHKVPLVVAGRRDLGPLVSSTSLMVVVVPFDRWELSETEKPLTLTK